MCSQIVQIEHHVCEQNNAVARKKGGGAASQKGACLHGQQRSQHTSFAPACASCALGSAVVALARHTSRLQRWGQQQASSGSSAAGITSSARHSPNHAASVTGVALGWHSDQARQACICNRQQLNRSWLRIVQNSPGMLHAARCPAAAAGAGHRHDAAAPEHPVQPARHLRRGARMCCRLAAEAQHSAGSHRLVVGSHESVTRVARNDGTGLQLSLPIHRPECEQNDARTSVLLPCCR